MNQVRLRPATRAQLFTRLAHAERAGLPWNSCIPSLREKGNKDFQAVLDEFESSLRTESGIARAGRKAGLFLPWESRLVQAAEECGELEKSFRSLARRYSDRARRQSRIRGGLVFPLLLFVLATLVAPLASLLTDAISIGQYLTGVATRIILLFGGLAMLSWGWRRMNVHGTESTIYSLILRIPWFGPMIRRQQQRDYLDSLAIAVGAGLPAFDALAVAAQSASNPRLRKQFAQSEQYAREGNSLSDSILRTGALENSDAENLLRSGEFSGRTEEMLNHLVSRLDEQLDIQYKVISDWTPRIAYVVVVILFLSGI